MKCFLLGVALVIAQGVATAQHSRLTEEQRARIQEHHQAFVDSLDLTDEQAREFDIINERYREQMEEIRTADVPREEKMEKLQALRDARDNEMQKLFTPEQYAMYDERRGEMKAQARDKMKHRKHKKEH